MLQLNEAFNIMKHLGPLRQISTRTLERTIGQVKTSIRSRSLPNENSVNVVKTRLSRSWKHWLSPSSSSERTKDSFDRVEQYPQDNTTDIVNTSAFIYNESQFCHLNAYRPTKNGQTIKIRRGKIAVVVYTDDNETIQVERLLDLLQDKENRCFSILISIQILDRSREHLRILKCNKDHLLQENRARVSIRAAKIIGYGLQIPSPFNRNDMHISWC
jgi:hypothetical protein